MNRSDFFIGMVKVDFMYIVASSGVTRDRIDFVISQPLLFMLSF